MSHEKVQQGPITPFYETAAPGIEIELRSEAASLSQHGKTYSGQLRIVQHWSPMRTVWEFVASDLQLLKQENAHISSESFEESWKIWGCDGHRVWGFFQGTQELGVSQVNQVYFHIPNYPSGYGGDVELEDKSVRWQRLDLECDGWIAHLESHENQFQLHAEGRELRNVVLTGVGVLRRVDRTDFMKENAIEILDGIRVFLSFAFGEWCPLVLSVGTDADGSKIWERWANYDVRSGWHPNGWLGPWQRTAMTDAFPGFYSVWKQPRWQEPLLLAVMWLIEANRQSGGVEGAIAFGQIPLEMLSCMVGAEDGSVRNAKRGERPSAASKIESLISYCGIPLKVPDELPALSQLANATEFNTGPKLVTKVRNTIIHPTEDNRRVLVDWQEKHSTTLIDIRWETLQMLKWYITLVMLRVIGYSGKYAKRLTPWKSSSSAEWVPWAPSINKDETK